MILWSEGRLESGEAPTGAEDWAAGSKRVASAAKTDTPPTEESLKAAAARAEDRARRIGDGLVEMDRWLCDQMIAGLARSWTDPRTHFERQAARLVDAQAPGLAQRVRDLVPIAVSGPGWPARILGEFALLHMVARAWPGRDGLDPELAQTLRSVVGWPVPTDEVAATPPVRGPWLVVGLRDVAEGKLTARRVWLHAIGDFSPHPWALVLSFTAGGQAPDASLAPGTVVDAQVHFYPGSGNYRALIGERFGQKPATEVPGWAPPIHSFSELADNHRALLAQNPWALVSPASTRITVVRADSWRGDDGQGHQVPLVSASELDLWRLHGLLAGRPGHVVGEWSGEGLRPMGVVTTRGLELL